MDADADRRTVLVVVDDSDLLGITAEALSRVYTVLVTSSAAAAAVACDRQPGPIDAILCEVGLDGADAQLGTFTALRPSSVVVWWSGFDEQEVTRRLGCRPSYYLAKPCRAPELLDAVRAALAREERLRPGLE